MKERDRKWRWEREFNKYFPRCKKCYCIHKNIFEMCERKNKQDDELLIKLSQFVTSNFFHSPPLNYFRFWISFGSISIVLWSMG